MKLDVSENLIDDSAVRMNSFRVDEEIRDLDFLIKEDIRLLKDMGFDKKMVNKVYILLNPENINRAIDYLTEVNGIYQHNYIQSTKPNEKYLCFICKKPRGKHIHNSLNNILNENTNINDIITPKGLDEDDDFSLDECNVCYESIKKNEKRFNEIKCGHLFCNHCWFNYLKTLITEASVEKIKCMDVNCNAIMTEEFILKHISENQNLITKYRRFKKRAEIIKDKKKRMCPNPDCDSFLKKSKKSKYVKCENGHNYCFECLNPAHGNNPCDDPNLEKPFFNWLKGKKVKRCPRCQMYTEKNEGCNHMTCTSCKYQWCWLCLEEYKYGHYESGKCEGKQFYVEPNQNQNQDNQIIDDEEIILRRNPSIQRNRNCNFGLHKIFRCAYPNITEPFSFEGESLCLKYLAIFGFWLFGIGFMFGFNFFNFIPASTIHKDRNQDIIIVNVVLTCVVLNIPFQILFAGIISPFILISIIYHKFFEKLLLCFAIGEK